jgi:16S rRNA G966 N2-methylase RsmD
VIINDNILKWCTEYKGEKFHALLCDPPYELNFMNKGWDNTGIAFRKETWIALSEHLYDGAFIMAFASSRGFHRMAVAMEDAGLIAHPFIGWIYGSGFPKATRIDTQIQAKSEQIITGNTRAGSKERNGFKGDMAIMPHPSETIDIPITEPTDPLAKAFIGYRYGLQALKPALEPILVFQKPYKGKPIDCITKSGAGCLNIDGGRIGEGEDRSSGGLNNKRFDTITGTLNFRVNQDIRPIGGRWPANVVLSHTPECKQIGVKKVKGSFIEKPCPDPEIRGHKWGTLQGNRPARGIGDADGTETISDWECPDYCPIRRLGEQSGEASFGNKSGGYSYKGKEYEVDGFVKSCKPDAISNYGDKGTASRFFYNTDYELENTDPFIYQAKASRSERDAGLNGDIKDIPYADYRENFADTDSYVTKYPDGRDRPMNKPKNNHPTIKPIKLTQHLATLLLPPKEYSPRRLLVPFAGVGSEMIGALLVGWEEVIGIELDPEYCKMAEERIKYWTTQSITKLTNNKEQLELPL